MNSRTVPPFFSIIVPTYNVQAYIDTCLQSIFSQTYSSFEIIVIDNASTDNTISCIQKYTKTHQITLIKKTINEGPGNARNTGIEKASGAWIMCIDGDDWIAHTRLEELYNYIQKNNVDIIADDNYLVANETAAPTKTLFKKVGAPAFEKPISLSYLLAHTPAIHPILKKDFLTMHGLRFMEHTYSCEDYGLWVRGILCGARMHCIQQPLYLYRQRREGLSKNRERVFTSLLANTKAALPLAQDSVSKHLLENKIREIEKKIRIYKDWQTCASSKNIFLYFVFLQHIPFLLYIFYKKYFRLLKPF